MAHTHEITAESRQCIQNCLECHSICTELVQHCLALGGAHAEAKHIRVLLDCAQLCATCVDFQLRTSHHHSTVCEACATVCEACAKDCEQIAGGDALMQRCAEACRKCVASCRGMAHQH